MSTFKTLFKMAVMYPIYVASGILAAGLITIIVHAYRDAVVLAWNLW